MTTDTQKKSQHTHHHHHHHNHHKKTFHLRSLERIIHLPVVESAHMYYEKMKNSNTLLKWSLLPAETGVWLAVGTARPMVMWFERPVSAVDSIVCQGMDVIEATLPVVTYPPEVVYNITKDYVTANVVSPVLKRADSVKQLSISGASLCGEMAANGLNNAIDVADKYVEKYLPEIGDATETSAHDNPKPAENSDSKTVQTIQHVNQFGRKLQRRLTRRTIAEAKALKQQSAETIRCLVYLVDLLARDPKAFMEKAKEVWAELSKDEPENQVPPKNLEQLIAMLTRELARRMVHLANFSGMKVMVLSHQGLYALQFGALNAVYWADYFIKALHLESALNLAASLVAKLHRTTLEAIERLYDLIKRLRKENMRAAGNVIAALAASPPSITPQPSPKSKPPSTTSSTPSPVASHTPAAAPTNPVPLEVPVTSQNGDTPPYYDSN